MTSRSDEKVQNHHGDHRQPRNTSNMKDHEFDPNNPEHLLERLSALEARKALEPLELFTSTAGWRIVGSPSFDRFMRYRRAPKPVVRPWNCPADVPGPVCWIRYKDRTHEWSSLEAMVANVSHIGFEWFTRERMMVAFSDVEKLSALEQSTDRVTWKSLEVPA